ncbi:MAG: type II secretion system inner membrane protein GspF [Trichloromonas sp.]|nr:type II secretion system inner membrane protein GspF [Trichloromonas sp.]
MPLFEYSGFDAQGKKVAGTIEAPGKKSATQQLRTQGIFPTRLAEGSAATSGFSLFTSRFRPFARKVSPQDLAAVTRQLATLLGAGLPLDEALGTLADQLAASPLGRALGTVRGEILQGSELNRALARHPGIFSPLFINMTEVGEHSGTLDQVLGQLADFLEDQARLRSRLQSALAYPILMGIIGSAVLVFLITFVVPKVTRMLEDMGQTLPLPTRLLIAGSDFLAGWWWLLLLLAGVAATAARRYARSEAGRLKLDRLSLRLPLFGSLNLLLATARLSRTLGTLLHAGVPLLKALAIAVNLLSNRVLRQAVNDAGDAVREGESLAEPLRRSGVFPPMLAQMAAVGERSGELEKMLSRVAETYEHQVELRIAGLLSLLEPVMILLMGTAVGFIVLAILLPIFQASQGMG